MRQAKMPVNEGARERLRDEQRRESAALAAVEAALAGKQRAERKLGAALQAQQDAVDAAEHQLALARADLVQVSGLARAATLLEEPLSVLRAAARTSREADSSSSKSESLVRVPDEGQGRG